MLIVVAGFSMHKQTNVSTRLPWKWNAPAQQMLYPFCKRAPESQRRREAQACHATSSAVAVALALCVCVVGGGRVGSVGIAWMPYLITPVFVHVRIY